MKNYKINQKGETLIEALGALAIISIVIAAVASSVVTALNNTKHNENVTLATKFAQQGVEQVRQIRNTNYTLFRTYSGLFCLGKGQTTLGTNQTSCSSPNVDTFIRSVQIEHTPGCSANVARITVAVSYTDGKCSAGVFCHRQEHTSCLSTINPVQAP